ncbi:MAG TPA: GNAT family N-acetyltransferase [Gaiellales bacterium]
MPDLRVGSRLSAELGELEQLELRVLCERAWAAKGGEFEPTHWQAALGGRHFVVAEAGVVVAHAAVVDRTLEWNGRPLRTGYVEAVATLPERQGEGLGSAVMHAVTAFVDRRYELGALDTGTPEFYEPLGWVRWPGRTGVRRPDGVRLTPEEDGKVLVRLTETCPDLRADGLLVCDGRRPGDPW